SFPPPPQSGRHPHKRAARWLLHCACRTSTVSSCAFHEQGELPGRPHIIFRTSFHSFATFALRGASPLTGSGTITASRRRCRNASAKAFVRPTPILSVFHPAACISSSFAPNAFGSGGSTRMCPTGNL